MPRTCTICYLDNRQQVDRALLGAQPIREIAQRFALSKDALYRHKEAHLPARLAKAHEAKEVASADTLVSKLVAIEANARRLGELAEAGGDLRTALMAVRELVRLTELAAKVSGELNSALVNVNVGAPLDRAEDRAEQDKFVWNMTALLYSTDPARFLEKLRHAAAEASVGGGLSYEAARADLEARERLPLIEATAESAVCLKEGRP